MDLNTEMPILDGYLKISPSENATKEIKELMNSGNYNGL